MKKRVIAFVTAALMIITAVGCNKEDSGKKKKESGQNDEVRTISISAGSGRTALNAEDTYYTLIQESHPVVFLCNGDENEFSKLAESLEEDNKAQKENQLTFIDENKDYVINYYNANREYYSVHKSTVKPFVRRADTVVTSILYYGYEYLGGAHGNYYYHGKNYDTGTGKELGLSDVVTDKEKLAAAVEELFEKHWSDIDENADIKELIAEENLISWTLDYNGITVYFMPYSIASYAAGAPTVTVSNEEYPDVLKEKYKEVPDSYGIELVSHAPFYYDVTGDGNVDKIYSSATTTDYEYTGNISININEMSYSEDEHFYDSNAVFVHNKDGKNYIYFEITMENDYKEILCYDLSYGVQNVGRITGGFKSTYHEGDDNVYTHEVLTNPKSFYLGRITHSISTAMGYKEYYIGDDGLPTSDDELYKFDEENMVHLTLRTDFEADIYDEKNKTVDGTKQLKAGDEVLYCSTDGESYSFLKCKDGTIVRVEVKYNDGNYYYAIDGVDIYELFDGIFFAG